jgi:DNA repair exonuclease SbcCD ATPase subunit
MIGVDFVKMEDLIVEMKPKKQRKNVCMEKWKHFFHLSGDQLLKTDSFVSGSIQNIVKMNSQTERSQRQLRRWANQRQQEKERRQQEKEKEKEYDDNQYMDMRETIARQTLTYMRTRAQLDMAREEINKLKEQVEALQKEKQELQENLEDFQLDNNKITRSLQITLQDEREKSQRMAQYISNLVSELSEYRNQNN